MAQSFGSLSKNVYLAAIVLAALGSIVGVLREQKKMKSPPPQVMQIVYVIAALVALHYAIAWGTTKSE
jgi:uncharacterized membrane protein YfcA